MEDLLLKAAREFKKISKYNYIIYAGKKEKGLEIDLRLFIDDFCHISGLDHLDDIRELKSKKLSDKRSFFNNILSGEVNLNFIKTSDSYDKPFPTSYNSLENRPYILEDRILLITGIKNICDNMHKGTLYKWNDFKSKPVYKTKAFPRKRIDADYLLKVQSKTNEEEYIYIFMCKISEDEQSEKLKVISIFSDCVNITNGLEQNRYTILKLTRYNSRTKEMEEIYVSKSLK